MSISIGSCSPAERSLFSDYKLKPGSEVVVATDESGYIGMVEVVDCEEYVKLGNLNLTSKATVRTKEIAIQLLCVVIMHEGAERKRPVYTYVNNEHVSFFRNIGFNKIDPWNAPHAMKAEIKAGILHNRTLMVTTFS